jgi:hypothetical protein
MAEPAHDIRNFDGLRFCRTQFLEIASPPQRCHARQESDKHSANHVLVLFHGHLLILRFWSSSFFVCFTDSLTRQAGNPKFEAQNPKAISDFEFFAEKAKISLVAD